MDYTPKLFHMFRLMLFCLYISYCCIAGWVCYDVYMGIQIYGIYNPGYIASLLIATLVIIMSMYGIISQLYIYDKNTLYYTTVSCGVFFTLYIGVPVFEYYISVRHRGILVNSHKMNETFQRYSVYNSIDALSVMRTQVDAKCCGYDNKKVWRLLGFDPAYPTTANKEKTMDEHKRLYPKQCCPIGVTPCSGDNVFDSGCRQIRDTLLPEVDARIQYRFNYPLAMCLIWFGLFFLHMLLSYQFYDLLIGRFFKTISGYDGSNYY